VTVRAIRDVVVWTIPKAQLLGLFGQKHTTFKERRRVLMRNSLFRDLREEQIEALSRMVTEKSVSGGQTVYRAGDSADNIYFVVKGSVKLCLGTHRTMSSEDGSSKGGTWCGVRPDCILIQEYQSRMLRENFNHILQNRNNTRTQVMHQKVQPVLCSK